MIFNTKCQQLVDKGVLISPAEHNIQPFIISNSWITKKPSSANKPFKQCSLHNVRLIVGFDPINKFLWDPPGKVTTRDAIYTNLAKWKVMAELDFSDFYHQIKFKTESLENKRKLGYLCIRTALRTLAFTQAPMGLLSMDVFQDKLTDRLFGDLVLKGKLCKRADNIYFGRHTLSDLTTTSEIVEIVDTSDLRIKHSKIKIHITSADILGLLWEKGTLVPSRQKLDLLAHCYKPITVKGLHSFLGAVLFNQICLNRAKLAAASCLLNQETPFTRVGKENIVWTHALTQSFWDIQHILNNPLTVAVPRE